MNHYENKLWGGRFRGAQDAAMAGFQSNTAQTSWLLEPDILCSIAHAKMLGRCGIIPSDEAALIQGGLEEMLGQVQAGELAADEGCEDVHTFVELRLTSMIGPAARKLHTARSRNDQVNVDTKVYLREALKALEAQMNGFLDILSRKAKENPWLMPGYTHLQRAQALTFGYWLMAYHGMFSRDLRRIRNALGGMDECPLGCGALAGTTHPIDRAYTAELLGFDKPYANFIDGVSDRDYILEALSVFAVIMTHLSRLAEELVLFSSREFGFISLDDRYATGSSIMPQKKNPDSAELIRGKTGRVYGSLMSVLTVMKGLPLAYNKDMQEDKEPMQDALRTVRDCLTIMAGAVDTLAARPDRMRAALKEGYLNATELADYLVRRGLPFRDAHAVVGQAVLYGEDRGLAIEDLSLDELRRFSPLIDESVYEALDYEHSLGLGIKREIRGE